MLNHLKLSLEQSTLKKSDIKKLVDEIIDTSYFVDPLGRIRSNGGGWQSKCTNDNDYHGIKQYQAIVMQYIRGWIDEHNFMLKRYTLAMTGWFNINLKGHTNVPHIHVADPFIDGLSDIHRLRPHSMGDPSGDYYNKEGNVNQPIFAGTFYLQIPEDEEKSFYFMNSYPLYRFFNHDFGDYVEVKLGDTLIFPPNLYHGVAPNKSDQPRVSYSFNVEIVRPVAETEGFNPGGIMHDPLNNFKQ